MLPHARCGFPRVGSLVPAVGHAFDHFVDDVLADLGAHEAVAEGLAFVQQHVPFAGVQDDLVGEAVLEERGGGDAGGEVGGVEGDCVWWVEVAGVSLLVYAMHPG